MMGLQAEIELIIVHSQGETKPCKVCRRVTRNILAKVREVVEGAITWQDYMWPQTTQSKEEMSRYQTGKITKEEHEDQRKVVFDEEFAIYKKAEKDTKRAILKAMED